MIPHPPPIHDYSIVHERRLRFVTNAALNQSISFQNLLDLLLMATSATTGADLFQAVRVKAVECWSTPALGSVATVQVVYDGNVAGMIGDQRIHTDSSMGIEPAHVLARPAPRSGAALFQESSANPAFYIDVPQGSVIDVLLSFKQPMLGSAVGTQNPLVAATTGALYARGLDGLGIATSKAPPPGGISAI
jgi:hypothetical protein